MKKSLFVLVVLTVCLSAPSVFTSYVSARTNTEYVNEKRSVNTSSIEISLGGDYAMFSPVVNFTCLDMNGCEKNMLTPDDGDGDYNFRKAYAEKAFSSTYAVVSGKYSTFSVNVSFDNICCASGVVTVIGKFVKDGKVVKTQTMKVDMSSDKEVASYTFNEDNGFSLVEEYRRPMKCSK